MDSLLFGTAGIPISTKKRDTPNGIARVKELKLGAMELEFVRGIYLKKDKTEEVKNVARKNNVVLTCHAPYFINLNTEDKKKYHASISYIVNSAKIASLCGTYSVCFHAGYYMKQDKEKVYKKIKEGIKQILKEVKEFDKKIWIRPEISGKLSQFGDLDEVIKLSKEIDQVMPCIDFAHFHARTNGKYNSYEEFNEILEKIEKGIGKTAIKNMHIHVSGINYGEKGEKNHLTLKNSDFEYKALMKSLKKFNVKGVLISESPNIEDDALLMKSTFQKQ